MVHASDDTEKGQCLGFSSPKNTLTTKPLYEATDSQATRMAPVLFLNYRQGPKANTPQAPCPPQPAPDCKGKDTDYKNQERSFNL